MAADNTAPKKLKRCQKRGKITAYPDYEIEELHRIGKINGWDTPAMAAEALTEMFARHAELLRHPAPKDE